LVFKKYLEEAGVLTEDLAKQITDEIDDIVNDATEYAENAPYPEAESTLKYVYEEKGGNVLMAIMTYIQAVTTALKEEMQRDEKDFVLGEDVGKKGGVFRATDGLYDEFGEARVLDTPLAESAIAGVGIGAAMYGMRPVAEMQFAD